MRVMYHACSKATELITLRDWACESCVSRCIGWQSRHIEPRVLPESHTGTNPTGRASQCEKTGFDRPEFQMLLSGQANNCKSNGDSDKSLEFDVAKYFDSSS
jgi:hypothetical protein